jgi:hypothetical protein
MQRGQLSGRFKELKRSATLVAISSFALASCFEVDHRAEPDHFEARSPLPGIFIVGAFPEIMGQSVVYEGVWLAELEGSQFFENETKIREYYGDSYFDTWLALHISDPTFPPISPLIEYRSNYGTNSANFVFVKFIGRRNVFPSPFGFGHLGTSRNVMMVEKVISAKALTR